MKKLVLAICGLLALASVSRASMPIDYDIIPTAVTAPCVSPSPCYPASAFKFSTPTGTWKAFVDTITGANCWSCGTRSLFNNDGRTPFVRSAAFVAAHTGVGTDVRLASYFIDYTGTNPNRDAQNRVWKRDWPALGNKPVAGGACTVCLRAVDITAAMNQLFVDYPGSYQSFVIEVVTEQNGAVGILNMGRLSLEFVQ